MPRAIAAVATALFGIRCVGDRKRSSARAFDAMTKSKNAKSGLRAFATYENKHKRRRYIETDRHTIENAEAPGVF